MKIVKNESGYSALFFYFGSRFDVTPNRFGGLSGGSEAKGFSPWSSRRGEKPSAEQVTNLLV